MARMIFTFLFTWGGVAVAWMVLQSLTGKERMQVSALILKSGLAALVAAIILTVFVQLC